jgi:rubrerythrin
MSENNQGTSNVTTWPPKVGPTNMDLPIPTMSGGSSAGATTDFSTNDYFKMITDLMGGGGGRGPSASDTLAREKWEAELASSAEAKRKRDAQLALMQQRLQSGGYREGIDAALRGIGGMEAETRRGVENVYRQALGDIGEGYGAAQGLTNQGFNALTDYLSRNQANPYAGLTQQMSTLADPMANTLAAYGITAPDVAQQVQAETLAGRQGAEAFQSLIDVLSGAQTAGLQSRGAEAQMARQIAAQRLGQERAMFESRAGQARQQSLSDLARWVAEQRFAQEQDAIGRRQDIIDELIAEGIDPKGGSKTALSKVEQVASTAKNLREAAKQFAPKYMENNPKATVAQITKKFPKLAEAVKAAKSK